MNWLTISIPAFNEEKNILPLIFDIVSTCDGLSIDYQILIINDGSTDNTENIIKKHFQEHPRVKLYNHDKNKGFGITLRDCFTLPDSEWIMNISGDNQFPAENIRNMLRYTSSYDLILGNRVRRRDNHYRKLVSAVYNAVISLFARQKINDISSIVLLKKSLICDIALKSKSGFIHAEIVLKALKNSTSFIEVELLHKERVFGQSSGGKLKTIAFTIYEMIKYKIGLL